MSKPPLWPIFICYRRVDGGVAARRLHEALDQWQAVGPDGSPIQIDAYLDETVPGVADWRRVHRPYLEKARALVVVCTPGAKLNEGRDDWVHREIGWWLKHRTAAPILIDPLMEGLRYVPDAISDRWPEIQRIPLLEREWTALAASALEAKTATLRRQILGAIVPSGAEVYAHELEIERKRAERLRRANIRARRNQRAALLNERVAKAALLDAQAAEKFSESRQLEAHRDVDRVRLRELEERLRTVDGTDQRLGNLRREAAQLQEDLRRAGQDAKKSRARGLALLAGAEAAWAALAAEGHNRSALGRTAAQPPHVFSVEVLNAGRGESILVHYGAPDDLRLVMINAGPGSRYEEFVEPRLRELGEQRFGGSPVPLELFIVSDRDEDKTGGLLRMLEHLAQRPNRADRLFDLRAIWFNVFRVDGEPRGLRPRIRRLIDDLRVPLNQPFDRILVRPPKGSAVVSLAGGLDVMVLGPTLEKVKDLYRREAEEAAKQGQPIEAFPDEHSDAVVEANPVGWTSRPRRENRGGRYRPSGKARAQAAKAAYLDRSISNLASTVLLFRHRGKTFLYSGDARGDLIVDGLRAAGLLARGSAHFDLMSVPHLGSRQSVATEFFRRVQAGNYLFSGDGRIFRNPDVSTVAALIVARGADRYRMWFVNRGESGGAEDSHGARFDAFFAAEDKYAPNYRRIFRSDAKGSMTVDLLEPVSE
jgi:beta-lactamase superfamily II metal-dependent hydrolase